MVVFSKGKVNKCQLLTLDLKKNWGEMVRREVIKVNVIWLWRAVDKLRPKHWVCIYMHSHSTSTLTFQWCQTKNWLTQKATQGKHILTCADWKSQILSLLWFWVHRLEKVKDLVDLILKNNESSILCNSFISLHFLSRMPLFCGAK
jgi:hypothetical protein